MALYPQFFSHNLTRKYAIAFGTLFRDIETIKYDSNGDVRSRVNVPITYAPKSSYFYKLKQDASFDNETAISLPRMAYEMTSMQYAAQRKTDGYQYIRKNLSNTEDQYNYSPVPYDLDFTLYIASKTQEEAFQVVEQIVPFFTPDYPIALKGITDTDIDYTIPVTLMSTNFEDNWQDGFDENRLIVFQLTFVMQAWYFGPDRKQGLIKHVDVDFYDYEDNNLEYLQMDVEPHIDGKSLSEIGPDDDYGFDVDITENVY